MPDTIPPHPEPSDADPTDGSRAARKAQTRTDLRNMAQRLFADRGFDAVTIATIAAASSVSVQTVFNHFATKEDLFFDGRATWVDGPADAVRRRDPQVPALTALRHHLVEQVRATVHFEATLAGRCYTSAISASASLSSRERELVHEAEEQLGQALAEAWAEDTSEMFGPSTDPGVKAAVVAATWLAATRVLVTTQREHFGDPSERASEVAALTDRTLRFMAGHCPPGTAQPKVAARF